MVSMYTDSFHLLGVSKTELFTKRYLGDKMREFRTWIHTVISPTMFQDVATTRDMVLGFSFAQELLKEGPRMPWNGYCTKCGWQWFWGYSLKHRPMQNRRSKTYGSLQSNGFPFMEEEIFAFDPVRRVSFRRQDWWALTAGKFIEKWWRLKICRFNGSLAACLMGWKSGTGKKIPNGWSSC